MSDVLLISREMHEGWWWQMSICCHDENICFINETQLLVTLLISKVRLSSKQTQFSKYF